MDGFERRADREDDDVTLVRAMPGTSPNELAEAMRAGVLPSDWSFDRHLPHELRVVSAQHWTQLVVAQRVGEWADDAGIGTVLDVGSGAGKLCVAAALSSERPRFVGLEQRPHLVEAACDLARLFGVDDRVSFTCGTIDAMPLHGVGAYYFYNPFGENLFSAQDWVDATVELSSGRFFRDVDVVLDAFEQFEVGTYVITYNGFGGPIPNCFRPVLVDRGMPSVLRVFRKVTARSTGRLLIEPEDED